MESKQSAKIQKETASALILSHPWKTFFFEAVLFSATIALGIISAIKLIDFRQQHQIAVAKPVSFSHFITAFALATFIILFIPILFKRGRIKTTIFKSLFVFTVFFGGILTLGLWLSDILALIFITVLIFGWLKEPSVFLHNLCLILAMAGLGATLGLSLTPLMVVIFLIIFSLYDFIAVYKTKHMIKMAKEMIRGGVILGFVAPQKLADFTASLKEVKMGEKFLILGGGDVVFPLLLVVSLIPQSIFDSLIVAFFSLVGLFASFLIFVSQKVRAPIPALPPIALFSILGFLITLLLKS